LCRRLSGAKRLAGRGAGLAGGAGNDLAGFGIGVGEGLDGDPVAEAFQAADVAAGLAVGVGALFVVAGSELAVLGCGVGQEAVGDGEPRLRS
jgi:hypothetical protein